MILTDFSLLRRRRELRLLILGFTVSLFGTMFTQVALAVQVYDLTGSTLAVGLLGAAEFVPMVALALVGGALADAFDRRRLVWGAELTAALVSAGLLGNALLLAPMVWPLLFVAAVLFAGASALWNETIPHRMRGRLAGVEMISWSSGPLLGNVRAGAGASWFGLGPSVVGGGVLVVAGSVALAAALPRFWNYDSRS